MNKKDILYIVEDIKSAQFRYRVYNMMQLFNGDKKWNVEYITIDQYADGKEMIEAANLIVIERQTAKNGDILKIIKEAHRRKKKILFDLDDLIFDYRDLLLLMGATNSKNLLYWLSYFWGIRRIAKRVDGFLCTNEFLAKKIGRSFDRPAKVIPNSLNKEQVNYSKKCLDGKKTSSKDFIIGYFSGSPTHAKDFRMIEPELIGFLNKYKDSKLRVVGYMDFSNQMKKMIDSKKVETIDSVNYLELQKQISEVSVNIAPLVINDFTNCKSELKYFEAAIVETVTIASPNYSFSRAIADGKNGFLAKEGEWMEKLEYLHNSKKDSLRIAKNARRETLKKYYGESIYRVAKEAYEFFAG